MLLVASETGHVYTFATRKLQPMITSESGKALIQTCLNSPDPPVSQIPNPDQRMSATGYEETDLTYTVTENEADKIQVRFHLEMVNKKFFREEYSSISWNASSISGIYPCIVREIIACIQNLEIRVKKE